MSGRLRAGVREVPKRLRCNEDNCPNQQSHCDPDFAGLQFLCLTEAFPKVRLQLVMQAVVAGMQTADIDVDLCSSLAVGQFGRLLPRTVLDLSACGVVFPPLACYPFRGVLGFDRKLECGHKCMRQLLA